MLSRMPPSQRRSGFRTHVADISAAHDKPTDKPRFRGFGEGSQRVGTRPETPGFASYLPSSGHLLVPPQPKTRKSRPNRPGHSIVAGTGFEPVTFGL